MRRSILVFACVLALSACGGGAADETTSSAGASTPAQSAARSSELVGADTKARCAGFGVAQAAEILGVAASAVTDHSQDITPTARGCSFSAGDEKKISFSLSVDASIDEAKSEFAQLRDTYVIAARAQESATGKKIEEGAYSDILGVGDEAVWSVTNTSLAVRHKNLTILVMTPSDKRIQVAIAAKILERL